MKNENTSVATQQLKIENCKIRKSLKAEDTPILEINIEYPKICNENEFGSFFNTFYERIAENFCSYCEEILFRRLLKKKKNDKLFRTYGEIMKYFITYNNGEYVSVVCDISHFNGYKKETKRFSFVWSCKDKIVLPFEYFEKQYCINKKAIRRKICETIIQQINNECCEFDYSEKSIRKYATGVNFSNFFLTGKGIAFWFDEGTLASRENGFPTFVYEFPS